MLTPDVALLCHAVLHKRARHRNTFLFGWSNGLFLKRSQARLAISQLMKQQNKLKNNFCYGIFQQAIL